MSRLAPPPKTPNSVHSGISTRQRSYIEPLPVPAGGFEQAVQIALAMPRTSLAEQGEGYARIVFTTALFRFKDDLELELDTETGRIHVRSASRVGRSDLGANRKRVEQLRVALSTAS